jgi:hypothetical protein
VKQIVLLSFLIFACPAFAGETLLGTVTSTGATKYNGDTAVTFTIPARTKLTIQCDAASYVKVGSGAITVASTDGLKLAADAIFPTSTGSGQTSVAVISASGTANCKVWSRLGDEG